MTFKKKKKSLTGETKEINICQLTSLSKKRGQLWQLKTGINCFRKTFFMLKNYFACKLCGANLQ